MKCYEVTLRVVEDQLPTVIGVIKGSADILNVRPCEEMASSKRYRFAGGKRNKGIKGEDLVMAIVSDRQIHGRDEFVRTFKERDFAASSVHSALSRAVSMSLIDRVGPHSYSKAGAFPQLKRCFPPTKKRSVTDVQT